MIFRHQELEKTLEWTDSVHLCELIIENPKFMREILKDLSEENEEHKLSFLLDGKSLNSEKEIVTIFNPLKLDFNSRAAITNLLKLLVKTSLSEDYYLETAELKTKIIKYLTNLVDDENFNFEVTTDEFGIDSIAKSVGLHIVGDEDDFAELLTDYMTMMAELTGIKAFVFIGLRGLLDTNELEQLHHNIDNHQLNVLLIERHDMGKIKDIPRILVDKDLCEL